MTTSQPHADSPISAFVLVPFETQADAVAWAAVMSSERADVEPPVIVTEGCERAWIDPSTGEPGYEVTFSGGWRAKVAAGGEVTIGKGIKPELQENRAA